MPLRVYAERSHYTEEHRRSLNDILKALWNPASQEDRRATYGNRVDLFEAVSAPDRADIHLLAMKWPHYVELGRVDQALSAVEVARRAKRPIAVFSGGDFEANFPATGAGIHVFQASAYRSRRTTSNHAIPAFIEDPLAERGGEIEFRNGGNRAVVGFCGQAGASLARHAVRLARNKLRRARWRLGRERWEPPPLEHTWFRQRVLDAFAHSPAIETRFVLRAKYRAGVHTDRRNDASDRARREFLDNVLGTDYTVSMRGGGNFSVRFYEALAMGRIPAFIDTDCVLPFQDQLDWRQYTAWIDEADIADAGRIVAESHARRSASEFRELQRECRHIWLERLTPDGFYRHFQEYFPELAS